MEQETLMQRIKEKDPIAFDTLYQNYSKSLLGVIYNIVKNEEVAEEVLQDVFIKIWNKADTYSASKGRIFTWMLNVARNAAIDKTRSKGFNKDKKNLSAENFVDIIKDNNNLNNQVDAIGISKYIEKLKKTCRSLIELLYFKGFTQKEASEELNIPIGTVKTRNRNCIGNLREMLLN
ncbi:MULTISPECIES: RNA polymerase sigma factor [Galbibacter]|uniref:Sigma-70 family RNA polymerase sigma factor n=1 Tax=Galbibacter pacificus TaxID=2996052 RepID=A0ABT6FUW1_9FLAO|nr:sigma-70 family RNA polymerase sigma factor [Galbibacter pacificus]MDG3583464.1 sigma-70 family RNA polymerase sigma factor [Galbibacter pacificus]MDG3587059.1 sigma-70 family RNA polymerase sigma factor [Galbibacter pacificus]